MRRALSALVVFALVIGCAEQALEPDLLTDDTNRHPELVRYAVALEVNVLTGKVSEPAPAAQQPGAAGGPNFALVGLNEIRTTASNFTRSAPVGGRVTLTFDVALTSLLNSGNLVTPTFPVPPAGVQGLLLIPFQIQNKAGPGTVLAGPQWGGAPFNFFNDFNCTGSSGGNDCYRYEVFPSPLGPGQTSPAQTVGFDIDSRVVSFTVLMILAADIQNTPLPPPPSGAISGHVTSPEAGALRGVTVTAAGQTPVTTDITGAFQLTGMPVGQATITLSNLPPGCTDPGPRQPTVLGGGLATADFSVTCPAPPNTTGSIAGTVTSPSLGNLYGVSVVVNPANRGAATDAAGVYAIPGVPQGQVTVSISNLPAGCTNPGTQQATVVAGGSVPVNFSVSCGGAPATGSLTGTLNAPSGPVGNVTVTLQPGNLTTTSDAAGVFSFGSLQPGTVLLTFAGLPTGCASLGTQGAEIVAGRGAVLNLQVNCGGGTSGVGAIRGTVTSPTAGPLPAIGIRAVGTGGTLTGTTGADGSFLVQGIAAGQVEVSLDLTTVPPACTAPPLQTIALGSGVFAAVSFTVACLTGVEGDVFHVAGPVNLTGVHLDLLPAGSSNPVASVALGAEPHAYRLLVPSGNYVLQLREADLSARCATVPQPVTVASFLTVARVEVACASAGWIAGRVHHPTLGAIPARVFASDDVGSNAFDIGFTSTGLYGAHVQGWPTANVIVSARTEMPTCRGFTYAEGPWDPVGTRIDVTVDCGSGTITGTVTRTDGTPIPSADVASMMLFIVNGVGTVLTTDQSARTDAGGAYSITTFAGDRLVRVWNGLPANCTPPADVTVSLPPNGSVQLNIQVSCVPVGSISGVLVDQDGAPVADAVVTATAGRDPATATTERDGSYSLSLSAGEYTVTADKRGACLPTRDEIVSVAGGQTTALNLTINCPPAASGTVTVSEGFTLPAGLQAVFTPGSGTPITAPVATDGSYRVTLGSGDYSATVTGFNAALCSTGTRSTGPTRQQQVLDLDFVVACASVAGTITDMSNQPVQGGGFVLFGQPGPLNPVPPTVASTTADGDGAYRLFPPAPGSYGFGVSGPTGSTCVLQFSFSGGISVRTGEETQAHFSLDCPSVASGTVTMTQGALPTGVSVAFTAGQSGGITAPLAAGGTWQTNLGMDEYTVSLQGLPSHCSVASQSTQMVEAIFQQRRFTVDFSVRCEGLVVSPSFYDYGDVGVDVPAPATFTLSNPGTSGVGITGLSGLGQNNEFGGESFNCPGAGLGVVPIAPGTSCTVTIVFFPMQLGTRSATVTFTTNFGPVELELRGTGVDAPIISFTPPAHDFGSVEVGATASRTFTFSNTSTINTGNLQHLPINHLSEFRIAPGGTCASAFGLFGLPAGGSCTIVVEFTPRSIGPKSETFGFGGRPGGLAMATMSGSGFVPGGSGLSVTPASHDFGEVGVDVASPTFGFMVTNTWTRPLGLNEFTFAGDSDDFDDITLSPDCSGPGNAGLLPGVTCTISARFIPAAAGDRAATLTITNSVGGQVQLNFSGRGGAGSSLTISPAPYDFGALAVGVQVEQTFTVTNNGLLPTGTLDLNYAHNAGDFAPGTNTCFASLGVGASCTFVIAFRPIGAGQRGPSNVFVHSRPGGTTTLVLSGTGGLTGAINGTVQDLDGQPVAGATITLGTALATSAGDGSYTLAGLQAGTHSVSVTKPGSCAQTDNTVVVASGQTVLNNLGLDCPGVVRGTVTSLGGSVIGTGWEVHFTNLSTGQVDVIAFVFPDGQYGPIGVPSGSYSVTLSAGGCSTSGGGTMTFTQQSQQVRDFQFDCPAIVAGTLSSPTRPPQSFAFKTLFVGGQMTTTDETGAFSVSNVTPGIVTIDVSLDIIDCISPPQTQVTAIANTTVRADIVVQCPGLGVIQGTVRDLRGVPVEGIWTTVFVGAMEYVGLTDAQGRYEITHVLALPGSAVAGGGYCVPHTPTPLTVQEGATITVDVTTNCPGVIYGTVTSSTAGPLAGVTVLVFQTGPAGTQFLVTTDANGQFTFSAVQDAQYGVGIRTQDLPAGCSQPATQTFMVLQRTQFQADIAMTCEMVET